MSHRKIVDVDQVMEVVNKHKSVIARRCLYTEGVKEDLLELLAKSEPAPEQHVETELEIQVVAGHTIQEIESSIVDSVREGWALLGENHYLSSVSSYYQIMVRNK